MGLISQVDFIVLNPSELKQQQQQQQQKENKIAIVISYRNIKK